MYLQRDAGFKSKDCSSCREGQVVTAGGGRHKADIPRHILHIVMGQLLNCHLLRAKNQIILRDDTPCSHFNRLLRMFTTFRTFAISPLWKGVLISFQTATAAELRDSVRVRRLWVWTVWNTYGCSSVTSPLISVWGWGGGGGGWVYCGSGMHPLRSGLNPFQSTLVELGGRYPTPPSLKYQHLLEDNKPPRTTRQQIHPRLLIAHSQRRANLRPLFATWAYNSPWWGFRKVLPFLTALSLSSIV